jgi:transposase
MDVIKEDRTCDQGGSHMDVDVELATLTSLLDLEEFEVVESVLDRRNKLRRFTLVPCMAVGLCPHCHGVTEERHLCRDREIRDLPMGGCRTELVVRLWQFHCPACDTFFTPRLAALAEGAHATERLLQRLAELAGHGDLATAARFFGLAEKTAEGWYYDYLERRRKDPAATSHLQPVRSLGIDELSLKKGTGNSAAC